MKKPKYIVEHDPLSYTGYGAYIVKENNELKTPYCVVFTPYGISKEKAKCFAKEKANKIASALEFQENVYECVNKAKK